MHPWVALTFILGIRDDLRKVIVVFGKFGHSMNLTILQLVADVDMSCQDINDSSNIRSWDVTVNVVSLAILGVVRGGISAG